MTWQTIKSVINSPCTRKIFNSILFKIIECTEVNLFAGAFGKYV